MRKTLALLGSTGSIGRQSLEVAESLGICIKALCANKNIKVLEEQARRYSPELVAACDEAAAADLRLALADTSVRVLSGPQGLEEAALSAPCMLQAMSGTMGLLPTLRALEGGARVCLANKETLVCAGALVMEAAAGSGGELLPVDSEHSAIFQCLDAGRGAVQKLILTASGGPFRGRARAEMRGIKAEDALCHPTWSMGAKITVDSATLMNKGLEFIEAMHLFQVSPEQIEILVHPQSVIHSMVEFCDGAVLAQLGAPDMRLPIQYALTYPRRCPCISKGLDLGALRSLSFEAPDMETFPLLALAIRCAKAGGLAPAVMNGANEAAVNLFLQGKTDWFGLEKLVFSAVADAPVIKKPGLSDVLEAQTWAEEYVLSKGTPCLL